MSLLNVMVSDKVEHEIHSFIEGDAGTEIHMNMSPSQHV